MVEHRALANLVGWHQDAFGVTAADRATLVAGVGFDASAWETWPYLTRGASLYVPLEELRTAPAELRDWLLDAGFDAVDFYDGEGEPLTAQGRRMITIARR
jgi:non-ribosomal peptide synthetase component F